MECDPITWEEVADMVINSNIMGGARRGSIDERAIVDLLKYHYCPTFYL